MKIWTRVASVVIGFALARSAAAAPIAKDAGPLASDHYAKATCPSICAPLWWNGEWHVTTAGRMAVCMCDTPPPIPPPSFEKLAGPLANYAQAQTTCPTTCKPDFWDGLWATTGTGTKVQSYCSCYKLPYAEGGLVKGSGPAIFQIKSGRKCQIPSMDALRAMGFKDGQWKVISDPELAGIPTCASYNAGDLVKGSGPAIYVIAGWKKCQIPSMDALRTYGFKDGQWKVLPDTELNAIPNCPVPVQEGELVKGSGPAIYVIKGGSKCLIPSMAKLLSMGYKDGQWKVIPDADLKQIPTGPPIPQ